MLCIVKGRKTYNDDLVDQVEVVAVVVEEIASDTGDDGRGEPSKSMRAGEDDLEDSGRDGNHFC